VNKKTKLVLFGRYVPMAGTKFTCIVCFHTCVGAVCDTFIELIEKQKSKLCQEDTGLGGERGGKYFWDPEIMFDGICSFSIIGNDETNFSVLVRTSTYRDYLLVSLHLRHFETL
jgi:hypothetical protein